MKNYDVIIVGAGFAGATLANKFASDGRKVLVLEKRSHIGGNMYEETLKNGVRIHKYGPHIFHTNNERVFDYLSNFTSWYFYEHKVLGKIDGKLVPIPFNFKSLELLFTNEQSKIIKDKLLVSYPNQTKVSILDLINNKDNDIRMFGKYVYEKVFVHYTAKQWNIPIKDVDSSVINRVPVILGYDDRYFQDKYQYMPKEGYTVLFEKMLNNSNIDIRLNIDTKVLTVNNDKKLIYNNKEYNGKVIYTGAIDEFLNYEYGPLPYRSVDMAFENYKCNYYQPTAVVNYPNEEKFTRITEFKYLTNQLVDNYTTILKEYPLQYDYKNTASIPYYAIINEKNLKLYNKYLEDCKKIPNLYLCGRLAEYKYYNMDSIVEKALLLYDKIK